MAHLYLRSIKICLPATRSCVWCWYLLSLWGIECFRGCDQPAGCWPGHVIILRPAKTHPYTFRLDIHAEFVGEFNDLECGKGYPLGVGVKVSQKVCTPQFSPTLQFLFSDVVYNITIPSFSEGKKRYP